MSNLRDIKKRITNVSVIEKMTQSMKAISTSRLSAAKAFRNSNDDYFSASKYIIETLLDLQKTEGNSGADFVSKMFSLKDDNDYKKTVYIIISSDRGLCGSYNHNIFKTFSSCIKEFDSSMYLVLPVGSKSLQFTKKLDKENVIDLFISSDVRADLEEDITKIANYISSLIINGDVDRVQFIFTKSQNIMLQEVITETVFPIYMDAKETENDKIKEEISKNIVTDTKNFGDIAEELLKQYISINIFDKMTLSAISEHASRLNAMSGAYDNSKELKRTLNLEYNRTRQGLITKELIEIISGAEVL